MAWLSDLAGRAENMLNKLDQNTASAFGSPQQESLEKPTIIVVQEKSGATDSSTALATPYDAGTSSSSIRTTPKAMQSNTRKLDEFIVSAIEREIEDSNGLTMEQELAATKILLTEIKAERNELKQEVSQLLNQIHNTANSNKQKAMEQELNELKETNAVLIESNRNMDASQGKNTSRISELEVTMAKLNQNLSEAQEKVEMYQQQAIRSSEELNNYRTRAQASLQLKERIIEELRANPESPSNGENIDQLSNLELEQLKNENHNLVSDRDSLIIKLESSQSFVAKLEAKCRELESEADVKVAQLTKDMAKSDSDRKGLQQENSMLNAEIRAVRTQANEMNQKLIQQVYDKDQEIARLRKRNTNSNQTDGFDDNLDNRIKSLTQSLIQKQTLAEEVMAERNALRIQLEKTESQYRSLSQQFRRDRQTEDELLHLNSMTDDDKAQLPLFMQDNPFDNQVAKRMKRVIRASDSLGASLGAFLRRYPLLRIVFLIYTVLLHIWVMVVLVSSTPN